MIASQPKKTVVRTLTCKANHENIFVGIFFALCS